MHRTVVVVDIEGFGDPKRTIPHQLGTRAGLYRAVAAAFEAAGARWADCYHEDRGDSVFVLVPPEIPKGPLLDVVPAALAQEVRAHNENSPPEQVVRLRMAVHAGEVVFDANGVTSPAINTTFRLLDAAPVKAALADSPGVLALIVSPWVFEVVVRQSGAVDPSTFRQIEIQVKETSGSAWIARPDAPYPRDPAVLADLTKPPRGKRNPRVAWIAALAVLIAVSGTVTALRSCGPPETTASGPAVAAVETPFEACPDGSVCVWESAYFTGGFKAYGLGDANYGGDWFTNGIAVNDHVSSYYNNTDQWIMFFRDADATAAEPCVEEQPRGYRADLRVEGCDNLISAHKPGTGPTTAAAGSHQGSDRPTGPAGRLPPVSSPGPAGRTGP
ncbi:peptidase inhibitor family I36 protein [Amycolatopsis sp. cg5]|uniref:peptidase inhibitor family I36 protein n=1 Tax=Amycolatopsis sp. cg5 TaxID=3238802 RepID=UPI0035239391